MSDINCEHKVSSEIYSEFNYHTNIKPTFADNNVVSRFPFRYPPTCASIDSDGDLLVQRKSSEELGAIEIEHSSSTELDLVGLQIWRGALLLGDWLLHNHKIIPKNSVVLELGSGVGLTSIVAARYTPVICTDINKGGILSLIQHNISLNKEMIKYPIKVTELDFFQDKFNDDITTALQNVAYIFAADVVYDDFITKAFVDTVQRLLSNSTGQTLLVALEKRYVFTIADCDVVAPCYEYFLECLSKLKNITVAEVNLDFPQYFKYDRTKELVLWSISSNKCN